MSRIFASWILLSLSLHALAETPWRDVSLRLSSGERRVSLIELYTSEGCSSCPPADRWLGKLQRHPGLWTDFVPLAFHVDYWDYIGWRDPYAQAQYGDRQRRYASEGGVNTVYTPGMFRNGREWRGWYRGDAIERAAERVGELELLMLGDSLAAGFRPAGDRPGELRLNVAVLGMDLRSAVKAGENHGELLHHDFTVLSFASAPLGSDGEQFLGQLSVPPPAASAARYAVAAWVSEAGRLAPIQSVGGYLDAR